MESNAAPFLKLPGSASFSRSGVAGYRHLFPVAGTLQPVFQRPTTVYSAAKAVSSHANRKLVPGWIIHLGALGVFGSALVDSCPIPTPLPAVPDILIVILGAHGEMPWLLALSGVAGSLIGGYLTWEAGKTGGEAMFHHYMKKRQRWRDRITRWVKGHGMRTIAIAGLLPPPLPTMPILIAAGALGTTRRQYLVAFGVSRCIRYGLEAAFAILYGHQILRLSREYLAGWSAPILYIFIGLSVAAVLFGVWKFRHDAHRRQNSSQEQAGDKAA
jgi:membrane protein YqaA with SNARE-associated domain